LVSVAVKALADDKVTFTAEAPNAVAVGDQFRLSYTVSTQSVRDFRAPAVKGFNVLMGPSSSRQSSTQIINGKMTSTSSVTYTYILMATDEGSFTIPGATITADGQQLVSNAVTVKVLPADKASASSGTASGAQGGAARSGANGRIAADDLFVLATASKTNVYEQQAFLLTFKIYTAVNLSSLDDLKLPDLKGFHSQEMEIPNNAQWSLEHYKGRNYRVATIRQFVLFPQQSGTITIDPARFDLSVQMQTGAPVDPFDAFFNGNSGTVTVKKTCFTPRLTINVTPLPSGKPADFSGGVGEFSVSSSINASTVKTGDAVTVKLIVSGNGNMKLLNNPEVKFPEDFETYDPKVDNKFRLTADGLTGSKVIEYLAIPRNPGTFKIPATTFSYFDIKSKSYKTLTTEPYTLTVEKGAGNAAQTIANFTNKEELQVLNEDIRFIKQNKVTLRPRGEFFFGSLTCWFFYLIPAIVFIIIFVLYRKQIAANANVAKVKTRKANKVAVKRLKQAGKLLADNKRDEFYDEVLKALWGYVSDKLSIPVSRLSKDNIEEELRHYGVDESLIQEFLSALNNSEFARFAPGDAEQAMDKVYTDSLDIISKMENSIKH
jgi:hypothetical protein